eukprot:3140807-Prymnesium_polylepis.1
MERVEINDTELAAKIWQRCAPLLPRWVFVDGSEESRLLGLPFEDPQLHGLWQLHGINPYMRVGRYPGGGQGHFGPHRDGAYEKSMGVRSLITLNGYLNDVPDGCGGRTRFLKDDLELYQDASGRFTVKDEAAVTHSVRPERGAAVVFYHGLMHDGEPLSEDSPAKWIFRFDVLYSKQGGEPDEKAATVRRMEVEANRIEREQPMVSMELYRLAEKLREGRLALPAAQARAAELLGREELLGGDVDTDTWGPSEEKAEPTGEGTEHEAAMDGMEQGAAVDGLRPRDGPDGVEQVSAPSTRPPTGETSLRVRWDIRAIDASRVQLRLQVLSVY